MSQFSKMALAGIKVESPLRGLLAGAIGSPAEIRDLISGNRSDSNSSLGGDQSDILAAIQSMESVLEGNARLAGRLGQIVFDFNNVHPLGSHGDRVEQANQLIRTNRRAMILASYAAASKVLRKQQLGGSRVKLWRVSGEEIKILDASGPEDVQTEVDRVFPR